MVRRSEPASREPFPSQPPFVQCPPPPGSSSLSSGLRDACHLSSLNSYLISGFAFGGRQPPTPSILPCWRPAPAPVAFHELAAPTLRSDLSKQVTWEPRERRDLDPLSRGRLQPLTPRPGPRPPAAAPGSGPRALGDEVMSAPGARVSRLERRAGGPGGQRGPRVAIRRPAPAQAPAGEPAAPAAPRSPGAGERRWRARSHKRTPPSAPQARGSRRPTRGRCRPAPRRAPPAPARGVRGRGGGVGGEGAGRERGRRLRAPRPRAPPPRPRAALAALLRGCGAACTRPAGGLPPRAVGRSRRTTTHSRRPARLGPRPRSLSARPAPPLCVGTWCSAGRRRRSRAPAAVRRPPAASPPPEERPRLAPPASPAAGEPRAAGTMR